MIMPNRVKVLWIEDDKNYYEGFVSAYEDEIDIDWYSNWDEGKEALNLKYSDYGAIILDAKCKHHVDSDDNAVRFMSQVQAEIKALSVSKKRTIPWYVLTGGDSVDVKDLINDDRLQWDEDWDRVYYSKGRDERSLVDRILAFCSDNKDARTQLRTVLFANVFEAIKKTGLDQDVEDCMVDLLRQTIEPIVVEEFNKKMYQARLVIDKVFRDMQNQNFLNRELVKNGNPILTRVSLALMGEADKISQAGISPSLLNRGNCRIYGAVPKIMAENIKNIIHTCGNHVHGSSGRTRGSRPYDLAEYHDGRLMTSYLLTSYAYQLCDFILWYSAFKTSRLE